MDKIINNYKDIITNKYLAFEGRATRSEYWYFTLAQVIIAIIAATLDYFLTNGRGEPVAGLISLLTFLPALGLAFRRLHDVGKSAWWMLIGIIPIIGAIVLLYFAIKDSEPDNKYGPNPKGLIGTIFPS